MTSRWPGRSSGRVAAVAILALSCVASTALANVRAAADVGLIEWSAGAYFEGGQVGFDWHAEQQRARLELGAEVTDNIGVTAGVTWAQTWAYYEVSTWPLSARVYWDFTPNELWNRGTAYVSATYFHNNWIPDELPPHPYVLCAVGATYTWYAVTVRAELLDPWHLASPTLLLGLEVGGSYIFGPHHEEPEFGY